MALRPLEVLHAAPPSPGPEPVNFRHTIHRSLLPMIEPGLAPFVAPHLASFCVSLQDRALALHPFPGAHACSSRSAGRWGSRGLRPLEVPHTPTSFNCCFTSRCSSCVGGSELAPFVVPHGASFRWLSMSVHGVTPIPRCAWGSARSGGPSRSRGLGPLIAAHAVIS